MRVRACEAALVGDLITTSPVQCRSLLRPARRASTPIWVNPPTGKVTGHAAQSQALFMESVDEVRFWAPLRHSNRL